MGESVEKVPLSLHPVIDTDVCIGSGTCTQACPEGDILRLVDGAARLAEPEHCIGHGKCAAECPVQAIRLVFGTSQRGVDLPEVDGFFESSRPGIHIVGELGGMGLIRNAVEQGRQAAERLASLLRATTSPDVTDLVIVGAGPAGLATALGCRAAGLSFRIVDQDTLGGTVANYPRQKIVMTEPVDLPLVGKLKKTRISKEELLKIWKHAVAKAQIQVEERTSVTGIDGQDGQFQVHTSRGVIATRKVVLAIGRRGTPRRLGVPGEELPKVSYKLIDPDQYVESRVLVVGGGDSALEAAIQLCKETDATVTLIHRGEGFTKCRQANRSQVEELKTRKRLSVSLRTQVAEIRADDVVLQAGEKRGKLANDYVIVCSGGDLPLPLLQKLGIRLKRYRGEALGEAPRGSKAKSDAVRISREEAQKRDGRRFALFLTVIGAGILVALAWKGWSYYPLARAARGKSTLHAMLRPAGAWGHWVGIVATLFMMSNFLYAARKRWARLKQFFSIRRWLTFHQFVGFMSPLTIAFHAAFQSNNQLASATAVSLGVVVSTGIVGRFIYGLVPTRDGRTLDHQDVMVRFETLKERLTAELRQTGDAASHEEVLELATAPVSREGLLGLFWRLPQEAMRVRRMTRHLRGSFPNKAAHQLFRSDFARLLRVKNQAEFYGGLKRFMSWWRVLHVTLALLLVVMITAHIGISLYLGYGLHRR